MKVDVEIQLLRDWLPRSRPSRGSFELGSGTVWFTKLYPGSAANGHEEMLVRVEAATRVGQEWCVMRIGLIIDGMELGETRPGMLYLGGTDIPSCVIHFPIVAGPTNRMYSGRHTILMRCA